MSVYFVVQEEIHDPEMLREYGRQARSAPGGGKLVALDDAPEVIEGAWHGSRVVILEFDDEAAFRAWYDSPEYQAAVRLRLEATDSRAALVRGR